MSGLLALLGAGLVAPAGTPVDLSSVLQEDAITCERADVPADATVSACRSLLQFGGLAAADKAAILFDLARGYDLKGDIDHAIANYSAAIKLEPDFAWAYYDRGLAYYAQGEYDRAITDNDAALRLRPDDSSALNNRGIAWLGEGKV